VEEKEIVPLELLASVTSPESVTAPLKDWAPKVLMLAERLMEVDEVKSTLESSVDCPKAPKLIVPLPASMTKVPGPSTDTPERSTAEFVPDVSIVSDAVPLNVKVNGFGEAGKLVILAVVPVLNVAVSPDAKPG
jgi:hypothetical protein